MRYANPIVGRAGLCNMLCPWARAVVWARDNGAKVLSPQWTNFLRIGPLLRGEKDLRLYLNSFTNRGYIKGFKRFIILRGKHCREENIESDASVIDFGGMAGFIDSFKTDHDYIQNELQRIANPKIVEFVANSSNQGFIGVHIRRGDFSSIGLTIDDDWYVRGITEAIKIVGNIPVRIFSDDDPRKLQKILAKFNGAVLMPRAPALQDLLLLSKSKMLVGTSGSSFSYWASFLGQMQSIWHPRNHPKSWRLDGLPPIVVG